jgi:hypothetical protein
VYEKFRYFKTSSGLFSLTGGKVSGEHRRLKHNRMNNNKMFKLQ